MRYPLQVASLYARRSATRQAITLTHSALEIRKKVSPEKVIMASYNRLARLYASVRDFDTAQEALQPVVKFMQQQPTHDEWGPFLSTMAMIENGLGNLDEAFSRHEQALEVDRKALPATSPDIPDCLLGMGTVFLEKGPKFFDASMGLLKNALERYQLCTLTEPAKTLAITKTMSAISKTHQVKGNFEEALIIQEEATDMLESQKLLAGTMCPELGTAYHDLGVLYESQKEWDSALSAYTEALQVRRFALPFNHPDTANTLVGLGNVRQRRKEYMHAVDSYHESLEMRKDYGTGDSVEVGSTLNNLAGAYRNMGDLHRAMSALQEALRLYRLSLPESSPLVARTRANMETTSRLIIDQEKGGKAWASPDVKEGPAKSHSQDACCRVS